MPDSEQVSGWQFWIKHKKSLANCGCSSNHITHQCLMSKHMTSTWIMGRELYHLVNISELDLDRHDKLVTQLLVGSRGLFVCFKSINQKCYKCKLSEINLIIRYYVIPLHFIYVLVSNSKDWKTFFNVNFHLSVQMSTRYQPFHQYI